MHAHAESHEGAKLEQMADLCVTAELEESHLGGDQECAAARDPLRMHDFRLINLDATQQQLCGF